MKTTAVKLAIKLLFPRAALLVSDTMIHGAGGKCAITREHGAARLAAKDLARLLRRPSQPQLKSCTKDTPNAALYQ